MEVVLSVESARDALRWSRSNKALLLTMGTTTVVVQLRAEAALAVVSFRFLGSGELLPLLTALAMGVLSKMISRCMETSPLESSVCWKGGIRLALAAARLGRDSCTFACTVVSVGSLERGNLSDDLCT